MLRGGIRVLRRAPVSVITEAPSSQHPPHKGRREHSSSVQARSPGGVQGSLPPAPLCTRAGMLCTPAHHASCAGSCRLLPRASMSGTPVPVRTGSCSAPSRSPELRGPHHVLALRPAECASFGPGAVQETPPGAPVATAGRHLGQCFALQGLSRGLWCQQAWASVC